MRYAALLLVFVFAGCVRPQHWSDPARDMVDVDVTPDGKWVTPKK